MKPPELSPAKVKKGALVAETQVDGTAGGVVSTKTGLSIRVPRGALGKTATFKVHEASIALPDVTLAAFGDGRPAVPVAERAFSVEVDRQGGMFPSAVTVSVPSRGGAVIPMVSPDGVHWRFVDFEHRDGNVVFQSRHFSPFVTLAFSVNPLYLLALGVAATTYMIWNRADELPSLYHREAPFVGVSGLDSGAFELRWSKRLPGLASNGFVDEPGFVRRLGEIARLHSTGCTGFGASTSCRAEINEARRTYLMTPKLREIEEALGFAKKYIESRGFSPPSFRLPVYVVANLPDKDGALYNPWSGRRYVIISANASRDSIYRTTLHELFHHYQTAMVFWDRNADAPMMEASATLMEREASKEYLEKGKVRLLDPAENNARMDVFRDGLDGPAGGTEAAVQRHGYGLSWFLEYLRDERFKGDKSKFHLDLLRYWSGTTFSALHKSLVYAAGGSEGDLGRALKYFAEEKALRGMVQSTSYGQQYFPGDPAQVYLDPYRVLDLTTSERLSLRDQVRPWSIQFYEVRAPQRATASVVARIPRSWSEGKPFRLVYFGNNGRVSATVRPLEDAEALPGSGKYAWVHMKSSRDCFLYVVDTGLKAGFFGSLDPTTLFLLEPPTNVKAEKRGQDLEVKWTKPSAGQDFLSKYFVYSEGTRVAECSASKNGVDIALEKLQGKHDVQVTSAIEVGTGNDGHPVYIESAKAGAGAKGVSVLAGTLPPGWKDDTSERQQGWSIEPRKYEAELLYQAARSVGSAGHGTLTVSLINTNKTLEELERECSAMPTNAWRLTYDECLIRAGATETTVGGFKAHRFFTQDDATDCDRNRRTGKPHASCLGAMLRSHYAGYLVELGGGRFIKIYNMAGGSPDYGDESNDPAKLTPMLHAEGEQIVRQLRIVDR
jgi:hypothetical protein